MAGETFSKLKASVNRGISTISVKTSSTIEKSKIKTHIDSIEREINTMTAELGKAVYEEWKRDSADFSNIFARCSEIKKKEQMISQLEAELVSIDERDNSILGNDTARKSKEKAGIVCPNCGAEYEEEVKFCRACGCKLQ